MDVRRPAAHRVEERLWDLVPVGGPHEELGAQRQHGGDARPGEALRLDDREAERPRRPLHGGLARDATRSGTVGLGDDPRDGDDAVLAQPVERLERRHRERRRPQEDDAGG